MFPSLVVMKHMIGVWGGRGSISAIPPPSLEFGHLEPNVMVENTQCFVSKAFACCVCRVLKKWGVCHPRNSGSTLASLHLENNLLEVERIPPDAFTCLSDAQGLVLYPQQEHNSYNQ